LVRHITKNNPGIFDRFITDPQSVPDNEAMQDIISGYLDKHHDAAPQILDTLHELQKSAPNKCGLETDESETMDDFLPVSYELRRRLERCARRMGDGTKRR
jgi:hypothetical protein